MMSTNPNFTEECLRRTCETDEAELQKSIKDWLRRKIRSLQKSSQSSDFNVVRNFSGKFCMEEWAKF
ncbi:hypothetical protein cypCar_00032996 [Cyprinus carpio]|nr:hypothetical protein cypCar_00032996 [Cyprinus carpio]